MLKVLANSKSSEIIFSPSAIVMSQSVKVPLLVKNGLMNFHKDLLVSKPSSVNLFKYFFVLFRLIDFFDFIYYLILSTWTSPIFIFQSVSSVYCFLKISIHKRCLLTFYKFRFQRSMFINCFQEILSYGFVIYIWIIRRHRKVFILKIM